MQSPKACVPVKHKGGRGKKRPPPPVPMRICVRPLRGQGFEVHVCDQDTINTLKACIQQKTGAPADKLCFVWCGARSNLWCNDVTLADLGMQDGAQIGVMANFGNTEDEDHMLGDDLPGPPVRMGHCHPLGPDDWRPNTFRDVYVRFAQVEVSGFVATDSDETESDDEDSSACERVPVVVSRKRARQLEGQGEGGAGAGTSSTPSARGGREPAQGRSKMQACVLVAFYSGQGTQLCIRFRVRDIACKRGLLGNAVLWARGMGFSDDASSLQLPHELRGLGVLLPGDPVGAAAASCVVKVHDTAALVYPHVWHEGDVVPRADHDHGLAVLATDVRSLGKALWLCRHWARSAQESLPATSSTCIMTSDPGAVARVDGVHTNNAVFKEAPMQETTWAVSNESTSSAHASSVQHSETADVVAKSVEQQCVPLNVDRQ